MTRQRSTAPTQEPNGTWSFIVDLGPGVDADGKWRERRQARRRGFPTRKAAQREMDDLKVTAREGTFVPPTRQTVREYLETEWLPAVRRRLTEGTFDSYDRNIKSHVIPAIGGIQLQALNGGALDRLYRKLETTGHKRTGKALSPRTVRYIHTILHVALRDAVRWNRVQANAADQATPPSARAAKAPEMTTWTGSQLASFLERTKGDRYGHAWMFLATTGCRRGEALGLRWHDLELKAGSASIRQQAVLVPKPSGVGREVRIVPGTKSGDARVIELDRRTVTVLRAWRKQQAVERLQLGADYDDHDLVFARPDGRPMDPKHFSQTFDRRLARKAFADLPRIRVHDLRHTWATLALEAGVDIAVVSKQLGHASPVVTWATYQHVRKGLRTDAAQRVANAIFGDLAT